MELRNKKVESSNLGIVNEDGRKIIMRCIRGPTMIEWITEEEESVLEKEGYPIEAQLSSKTAD